MLTCCAEPGLSCEFNQAALPEAGRPPCCCCADAVLFGCLAFIRGAPVVHEHLRRKLDSHSSLVAYLDRIAATYFAHGVPSAAEDGNVQWSHWESAGGAQGER
jgi:hypothetical protein